MVCAAGHTLKAKGGKSIPERWLVFSVCPKALACSKNHSYVVPTYMEPSISPSTIMEAAFGRLHNSGAGAFGARPTVVESIKVDGEIDGSIYGTIYPTIYGSKNGARNNNPSGRIINSRGRITD